ncbi:MAG: DmsE family decaheme c-type cytochrome [Pseudomonadota bacterium]
MRYVVALGLLIVMVTGIAPSAVAAECMDCHEAAEVHVSFRHQSAGVTCADCHGPSLAHLERRRNPPDVIFRPDSAGETVNGSCLACHDDTSQVHWLASGHGAADVACSGCHKAHETDPALDERAEATLCGSCHRDVVMSFKLPHRHPVPEGAASCTSCHNPHGSSSESLLAGSGLVDTCVACHRDMKGPFLFEHDPVTEDCGLCHKPHGSTTDALLLTRPPFLCQQCHMAAGHPSRLADGSAIAGGDSNLLARGCSNCHSQVHGSNHPGGARLMR